MDFFSHLDVYLIITFLLSTSTSSRLLLRLVYEIFRDSTSKFSNILLRKFIEWGNHSSFPNPTTTLLYTFPFMVWLGCAQSMYCGLESIAQQHSGLLNGHYPILFRISANNNVHTNINSYDLQLITSHIQHVATASIVQYSVIHSRKLTIQFSQQVPIDLLNSTLLIIVPPS